MMSGLLTWILPLASVVTPYPKELAAFISYWLLPANCAFNPCSWVFIPCACSSEGVGVKGGRLIGLNTGVPLGTWKFSGVALPEISEGVIGAGAEMEEGLGTVVGGVKGS